MNFAIQNINIKDYSYNLDDNKIAYYPAKERDLSKLLIYKDKSISQSIFKNLSDFIPYNSFMVFNNSKVIYARLLFHKTTGAEIEIFLLEPINQDYQQALAANNSTSWLCFVGNQKKWKNSSLEKNIFINGKEILLKAEKIENSDNGVIIRFDWETANISFAEIVENSGLLPLPPYIKRKTEENDKKNYQTIYALHKGSVAAPTAGLHFTDYVFESLKIKNIASDYITLHVGAGTFKPVSTAELSQHIMHEEIISFEISSIKNLLNNIDKNIIAVGTTTTRALESLYWFGTKLLIDKNSEFKIEQWEVYQGSQQATVNCQQDSRKKVLLEIITYMDKNNLKTLTGRTKLIIIPGYKFRLIDGLITNFHQPKSSLLLLIAAFLGEDWKKVYDYALNNDFRFLSYGDSCLFL